MKQGLKQLLILLPLLFIATVAQAYREPTTTPTGGNSDIPIQINALSQIKPAGLSVGTFQARGNGWLKGETIVGGMVRGGTPASTDSQVIFGNVAQNQNVSVKIHNSISADGTIQTDDLISTETQNVCADTEGKLVLCVE